MLPCLGTLTDFGEGRKMKNRYIIIYSLIASTWAGCASPSKPVPPAEAIQPVSLRNSPVKIGAAIRAVPYGTETAYFDLCQKQFKEIIPETDFRMTSIQKTEGNFNFTVLDKIVEKAAANDQLVIADSLVYGRATPKWVSTTSTDIKKVLASHIGTVMAHFLSGGRIRRYKVVNEAIDGTGELDLDNVWYVKAGPEFIELAYTYARGADPEAILTINEATHAALPGPVADKYLAIVTDLANKKLVDVAGFQLHVSIDDFAANPDPQLLQLENNLRRFTPYVKVEMSEVDVRIPEPVTPEKLARQAMLYGKLLGVCQKIGCSAFTLWGFTDKYSWVPEFFPGSTAALPWDANYQAKPAAESLGALR